MDDSSQDGEARGILAAFLSGECFFDSRIGLVRPSQEGWLYLRIQRGETRDTRVLVAGRLTIRGFTATLEAPLAVETVRASRLAAIPRSIPSFPLLLYSLDAEWCPGGEESIPELDFSSLEPQFFARLAADTDREYYWHKDFDPAFYRAQARKGFIAITMDRGDRHFLVSELHAGYSVLDWDNLHLSRTLRRLFRSERYAALQPSLAINPDPRRVLARLSRRWRETWLVAPYRKLVRTLAAEPAGDLRFWGVELHVGGEAGRGSSDRIVAGELGYTIGRTYTSLSGFYDRSEAMYSDMGKVQLHLLARHLREKGYAFWNLGDPRMQYKADMGARILPRAEFLERWEKAVAEPWPGM
ncbi:MAG TPA: GNAT family N-acetyltransferase [Rectinemataceae bacterium]